MSFWIFGTLLSGLVAIIVAGCAEEIAHVRYDPVALFFLYTSLMICTVTISVWQLIGFFRSAKRNNQDRKAASRTQIWGFLAYLSAFVGWGRLAQTIVLTLAPQSTELFKMAFDDDPSIPAYTISLVVQGRIIVIHGGFKYGLSDDLIRLANASPKVIAVEFDSPGGRIGEAREVYNFVKNRGLSTFVEGSCQSACTAAYAAGKQRWLKNGGLLGFHAGSFVGLSELGSSDASDALREIYQDAGFRKDFTDRALKVPPSKMWTPDVNDLIRANVVTNTMN